MTVLSLMSGTSLDGMDVVVARFEDDGTRLDWEVLERAEAPYPVDLRERLIAALHGGASDVAAITQLHAEIGHAYAALCGPVCDRRSVDLVALSGQNVYHVPRIDAERGWRVPSTLQLGEGALVLERCRVPVACDFRQSDRAAGGQGAPMVSYGDLRLHHVPGVARAIHNLGGISNVTWLPPDGAPGDVVAFDTGPGNCLIDEAVERTTGAPFDAAGAMAGRGRVDEGALSALMRHPYLRLPFPKTTGREVFELERTLRESGLDPDAFAPEDLVATLTAFTAASIAHAYEAIRAERDLHEVLLAGGGAANPTLVGMLRERLAAPVRTFEDVGMVSKDREALAFGVMAYDGFHGRGTTLPNATGASRSVVAGKFMWPDAVTW
ncbi:anhydro-N-acetylmuramic acid kinase AnmK [soil metagenome]